MTARTRVCIYGVRTAQDALAAANGGADAVGFFFLPSSARYVRPEAAWEIAQQLPPFVSTIGVFTNADVDRFCQIEERCPTDYSQLHGDEPEDVVRQCGPRVIKTVKAAPGLVGLDEALAIWERIDEVDAVLVTLGDVGGRVQWPAVARTVESSSKSILLGGGLTAAAVGEAVRIVRPWGVAVREGVEGDARQISEARVREFCAAVRSADLAASP